MFSQAQAGFAAFALVAVCLVAFSLALLHTGCTSRLGILHSELSECSGISSDLTSKLSRLQGSLRTNEALTCTEHCLEKGWFWGCTKLGKLCVDVGQKKCQAGLSSSVRSE